MGRANSKSRKKKGHQSVQHQHLPKVGTSTENDRLLHEEQQAVLGQMGVRNASSGVKAGVTAVVVVLIVAAILGLTLLIVFR